MRVAARGGDSGGFLDADRILGRARQTALLEDFGPGDFRSRFDALLRSLNASPVLSQRGPSRDETEAELVALLTARLRLRDWQKKHGADGAGRTIAPTVETQMRVVLVGSQNDNIPVPFSVQLLTAVHPTIKAVRSEHLAVQTSALKSPPPQSQADTASATAQREPAARVSEVVGVERLTALDFPESVWGRTDPARRAAVAAGDLSWAWMALFIEWLAVEAAHNVWLLPGMLALASLPNLSVALDERGIDLAVVWVTGDDVAAQLSSNGRADPEPLTGLAVRPNVILSDEDRLARAAAVQNLGQVKNLGQLNPTLVVEVDVQSADAVSRVATRLETWLQQ